MAYLICDRMVISGFLRYGERLLVRNQMRHSAPCLELRMSHVCLQVLMVLQPLKCVALCENLMRYMKLPRLFYCTCLALSALTLSQASTAITMGRLRGASVLGQPLDLTVPLQVASDENTTDLCVSADVYYGDVQVEPSLVTAYLDHPERANAVRMSVRRPVDEPVVTIYVKTGCQQQSVRKFVMLSEFATETQRPSVASISPAASMNAGSTAKVSPGASVVVSQASAVQERPARSKEKVEAALRPDLAQQSVRAGKVSPNAPETLTNKKDAVANKGARLKLLPLELTQGWEPILRSTDELTLPSESASVQKRAEAAEFWRVISASPEEILHETHKRSALEAELRSLVTVSRSNQVAIQQLNTQLREAKDARLFNPVVYLLLSLLVGCGFALGFVIYYRRHSMAEQPWWAGADRMNHSDYRGPTHLDEQAGESMSSALGPAEPVTVASHDSQPLNSHVDSPVTQAAFGADVDQSQRLAPTTGGNISGVDFSHSVTGALRAINTQEMVDVRQQADFFLALGQHDDAIGVLYGALGQSTDSNPYIYLDLIALLHKLSRKEEYERVRTAFNMLYTGVVPAYGAYSDVGHGLLDYSDLCLPLVGLWPARDAMDYIEQCLVREPSDPADTGISLEAFKDLLLLHGILRNVMVSDQSASSPHARVPLRKLPELYSDTPDPAALQLQAVRSSHGLDLDLS